MMSRNSTSSKEEIGIKSEQISPSPDSHKITTFFPVLRGDGRAKMGVSKTGDGKQKEILQRLKTKELRSKSQDSKSTTDQAKKSELLNQTKEKLKGNIMGALKTPLSEVLRRNIEESESKKNTKEKNDEKSNVFPDPSQEETMVTIKKEIVNESPAERLRANLRPKKAPEVKPVRKYQRHSTPVTKPLSPAIRSVGRRSFEKSDKRKNSTEPSEVSISKGSVKISVSLPTNPNVSSLEDSDNAFSSQNNSFSGKLKRKKKPFRGGTYGLFFSRKKKKITKSTEETRDDNCSLAGTENSSYADSDEGNSLMSEELYTPSEKSLADEEPNIEPRNSPTPATAEVKLEIVSDVQKVEEREKEEDENIMQTEEEEQDANEDRKEDSKEDVKEDGKKDGKEDAKEDCKEGNKDYNQEENEENKDSFREENREDNKEHNKEDNKKDNKVDGKVDSKEECEEYCKEDNKDEDMESSIEDNIEDCVEDNIEDSKEDNIEDSKEDNLEDSKEDNLEVNNDDSKEDSKEDNKEELENKDQSNTVSECSESNQNITDILENLDRMHWEDSSNAEPAKELSAETLANLQYDDISNESCSTTTIFQSTKESSSECSNTKNEIEEMQSDSKEEQNSDTLDDIPKNDDLLSDETKNENSEVNHDNVEETFAFDQGEKQIDSMKSGDEHDNESVFSGQSPEIKDPNDEQSTIANCVKSRQRIKRRFTDDIVDTEMGLLSINSMTGPRKKEVAVKPDPPKDVIQTFQSITHSEAKKGPLTKIEVIFNSRQPPVMSCTCEGDTYEANLPSDEEGVFCQAVDSIDDKLVGCSNPVVTTRLVRSSVKIPFNIMCEMHLWRLKHHHSCPYCGLFCSQGQFMQCVSMKNKRKVVHLYHEQCQSKEEGIGTFCLHCGATSDLKHVTLEMHMASPPSFFLSQLTSLPLPHVEKARISISNAAERMKEDEDVIDFSYKIEDTGRVLSSVGLKEGPEKDELERLLQMMNENTDIPNYHTHEEFYTASAEGDLLKVLNILARGIDPNLKFPDHEDDTSLHAAAANGQTTVVHLLIQAGAINDSLNERIYTPLMLAVENNHNDVVFYLIKNGALADFKGENGMSSFHMAAKNGNLDILKILMSSRNVDINSQDDGGWTPIVWASEHDHYEVVKYLLKRGANPNIKDSEGNTGLHWSAFSGSVDISYLYLDYGCDINATNERGDTPLHIAARQDALSCVTLFLSRNADVQIRNKNNQLPAECVLDKTSDTYLSLSLNMLLKKIAGKYQHKAEKILHKDISRGKEQIAIPCVNEIDNEPPPLDFLYVTENCETTPMNIDRTITSLQSCNCEDDCSSSSCVCSSISYQCWYDKEGLLLPTFNLIDPPMLFECNRACNCWALSCRNRVLQNGITCRLQLIRTKGKGWGVRTLKDIPRGTFICEYVGEMISDSAADKRADDSYLFDLDNRDGETYCLDARYYGNISRFINHLCEPNLVPVKVYVDHQDLNFPRIAFFSSRDIKQYEELGFDYCEKFWVIKYKYFTCDCGSAKCKYSKDTIHHTLANYYRRVREEQQLEEGTLQTPSTTEVQ